MSLEWLARALTRRMDKLDHDPEAGERRERRRLEGLSDAELLREARALLAKAPTSDADKDVRAGPEGGLAQVVEAFETMMLAEEAAMEARARAPAPVAEPSNVESVAVRTVETPLELPIEAPALVASAPAAVAEQRTRVERVVVPIPPLTCPGCGLNVSPGVVSCPTCLLALKAAS